LCLGTADVLEHLAQLRAHLLHAGRRHDLHTHVHGEIQLDLALVQRAFAQLLAQFLAGVAVDGRCRWRIVAPVSRRALPARQQGVEDAILGAVLSLRAYALDRLFTGQLVRHIGEVADDRLHVLADIADLGELGRLDLHERRVRQRGEAPRDLGLADAGGTDHQDVFRCHFFAHAWFQLHAPPAAAQCYRHGALGVVLADDVAVEFVDDFTGSEFRHESPGRLNFSIVIPAQAGIALD
jgi:hypothetical protein